MPTPRGALAAAVLNGRIHALGGAQRDPLNAHEVYDPAPNVWKTANALPTARDHLAAVTFRGRVWALGGRSSFLGSQYANVEIYEPAADAWRTGAPLPRGRGGLAAAALPDLATRDVEVRRRAAVSLAETGTMADVPALVSALRDADERVRGLAERALWEVWSRSGNEDVDHLLRAGVAEMQHGQLEASIDTFSEVIRRRPDFAEGWNKRATVYYLVGEYRKSAADCDEVLKRNPAHFGALSGYGMIWLRLDAPARALEPVEHLRVVGLRADDSRAARHRRPRHRRAARPGRPVGRGAGQHPQGARRCGRGDRWIRERSRRGTRARLFVRRRARLGLARVRPHGGLRPAREGRRPLGEAGRPRPRRPARRGDHPEGDRRPGRGGGREDRGRRAQDHRRLPVARVHRREAEGSLQADPARNVLGGRAARQDQRGDAGRAGVARLVLFDGGLDVRAEVLDSLAPAVARLGVEFPSLESFLERLRGLPMFAGRWNDYLTTHYTYDVERTPGGGVRSKVVRHAIEEEVANLQRTRLWVWHHQVQAPTLLLRAPDGLLTEHDCLVTQEEAEAMAHAIPRCRLVVVPGTNHYTVLLSAHDLVRREVAAFLAA